MHWLSIAATLTWASSSLCLSTLQDILAPLESIPSVATVAGPSYRSDLLALHKSLISTRSISGDEGDVGSYLVDYLTERGYRTSLQFVRPRDSTPRGKERFNVMAWKGDRMDPEAKVLVTSHIDVVPPHIEYGIEDGEVTSDTRIWGRGSVDAKGSVAAMIIALEELQAKESKKKQEGVNEDIIEEEDVMLLFVVGEEVAGDGMIAFSEALESMQDPPKFDAVIFGEPTENKLACGHKGALFCDIKVRGVGGHSGYPWLGKSANEVLIRALGKIMATDLGSSEEYGNTTINVGKLEGGVAHNVIAEEAFASVSFRVAIGPEEEGGYIVEEKVKKILKEVDEEAFEPVCSSEPYGFVACDCEVDGKLLLLPHPMCFAYVTNDVSLGFESIVVNYGTDIPHLKGDHTRYLYGPGSILVAHGSHENLTVSDLEVAVEDYQKLILHALKKSTSKTSLGHISEDL